MNETPCAPNLIVPLSTDKLAKIVFKLSNLEYIYKKELKMPVFLETVRKIALYNNQL